MTWSVSLKWWDALISSIALHSFWQITTKISMKSFMKAETKFAMFFLNTENRKWITTFKINDIKWQTQNWEPESRLRVLSDTFCRIVLTLSTDSPKIVNKTTIKTQNIRWIDGKVIQVKRLTDWSTVHVTRDAFIGYKIRHLCVSLACVLSTRTQITSETFSQTHTIKHLHAFKGFISTLSTETTHRQAQN